jgi:hypothetical protein
MASNVGSIESHQIGTVIQNRVEKQQKLCCDGAGVMVAEVGQYFEGAQPRNGQANLVALDDGITVGPCRVCGAELRLCPAPEPNRGPFVACCGEAAFSIHRLHQLCIRTLSHNDQSLCGRGQRLCVATVHRT